MVNMESIETSIKLITDYGVLIVIAAIFLYGITRIFNLLIKAIESKLSIRKHDQLAEVRSNVGREIQSLIDEFIVEHDGLRVQVIEFSNSVISVAYLPFKYMSCTYEVCGLSIKAVGKEVDKISTSLFTPFFEYLYMHNTAVVDCSCRSKILGGAIYDLLEQYHIKYSICSLLTHKGKGVGFVLFQVANPDQIDSSIKTSIADLSDRISGLLGIVDK